MRGFENLKNIILVSGCPDSYREGWLDWLSYFVVIFKCSNCQITELA
jgi:hypothetical protein